MQNHTVVQFPLESSRAIKKQFEVEIDVPWGLLPGMRCLSETPGARELLNPCTAPEEGTLSSPLRPCHSVPRRSTARPRHLAGSAEGKRSRRHPTAPRCIHHRAQGTRHSAAVMAPCFLSRGFFFFSLFYPPDAVPQCDFLDVKYQGIKSPSALVTDSDNKHGSFSTGSASSTENQAQFITTQWLV